MYTVTIEAGFSARHRVRLPDGVLEPPHSHDWRIRALFGRDELDESAMVIDFDRARSSLESVLAGLHQTDLNHHRGLAGRNPTAEVVARYVFEQLRTLGLSTLRRIDVTEAPGCVAGFELTGPIEHPGKGRELTMNTAFPRMDE